MKRPMKRMFQRSGPRDQLRIHAVVGDADRRHIGQQIVQQDLAGQQRRNGRNSDAAAMLIMLPRFALIVVSTYFSVFAKVLRPSSMPRRMTSRLRSSSTKSRRLAGHVDRLLDREAGVGRVHGGRVVDAVAQKADDVPHLLERQDDPLLLIRIDLDEEIACARRRATALRRTVVELARR